jgi:hypothetical protein
LNFHLLGRIMGPYLVIQLSQATSTGSLARLAGHGEWQSIPGRINFMGRCVCRLTAQGRHLGQIDRHNIFQRGASAATGKTRAAQSTAKRYAQFRTT